MADIFVSYTSSDKAWADWIGQELVALGHTPHLHDWEISGGGHEWEISGGGDIAAWMEQRAIAAWMEERHDKADHILCVISEPYLKAPYSSWERRAAQWAAAKKRPNFALPVYIENCESPTLLAQFKRCDPYGLTEDDARARLAAFLAPAAKPAGPMPSQLAPRPRNKPRRPQSSLFPTGKSTASIECQNASDQEQAEVGIVFDVFLSHSHTDSHIVEVLAKKLEAKKLEDRENLRVWLDKWILVPGNTWRREMAIGLKQAKTCAVCRSRDTPKGWFQQEIQLALNRQAIDNTFRVIPPNTSKWGTKLLMIFWRCAPGRILKMELKIWMPFTSYVVAF
jgi:TIR domain